MLNASMDRIKEIELLDAMCGTGKSHNIFKVVSSNPTERYIYVTPMLTEASSRPTQELAKHGDCGVTFHEPNGDGYRTKGDHLLDLLESGKNVSCTHSLFQRLGKAGRQAVWKHEYIVIIDEELGMIDPLGPTVLAKADQRYLIDKGVIAFEVDGRVVWQDDSCGMQDSKFAEVRKLAEDGSLYSTKGGHFFNMQLPVDLISAAKRVIVATYLYEGSILQAFLKVKRIG